MLIHKCSAVAFIAAFIAVASAFAHPPGAADVRFIDGMTMHHQGGVKMAQMAVEKAQHAELRDMAKKMIADQQSEIATMQGWRKEWAEDAPMTDPSAMPGMMPESETKQQMERLQNASGNEFDLAFTEIMAMHHEGAIKMAKDALGDAKEHHVLDLARKIIDAQTKEQKMLRRWHTSWSGGSVPTHRRMMKD